MEISNDKCFECGCPSDEAHHVIPRSYGGTKTIPLCNECHGKIHGVDRVKTRYMVRLGLAKKYTSEYYAYCLWSMMYDNTPLADMVEVIGLSKTSVSNIIKNMYMFEWDDLYGLAKSTLMLEENKFYTEEMVKEDWLEFKDEFPDLKTYSKAIRKGELYGTNYPRLLLEMVA